MREVKLRGRDAEFCNEILKEKCFDLFVGYDSEGNEVYEGDIVTDENGEEYKVSLSMDLDYVPSNKVLANYTLIS